MDANGLRFWMAADQGDWTLPAEVVWDDAHAVVRLSDVPGERRWPGTKAEAAAILKQVPQALDQFDRIAFVEVSGNASTIKGMKAGADRADAAVIFQAPEAVTDLAIGADSTLFVAAKTTVWLRDLHFGGMDRWEPVPLRAGGLKPLRLAADPGGGCWVLCHDGTLARVSGQPIPHFAEERAADAPVRPHDENPKPPSLAAWFAAPVTAAGETPACICYSPENGVAVIAWTGADAKLYLPLKGTSEALKGIKYPTSAKWLDKGRLALLYPGATEAAIWEAGRGFSGDLYPLNGPDRPLNEPFLSTDRDAPWFLRNGLPRKLACVSLPWLQKQGMAYAARAFDSGDPNTVWHRLYLEAAIPPHCSIEIHAAASQSDDVGTVSEWHAHVFGRPASRLPSGVWLMETSEVPFHPGVLKCPRQVDRAGLFAVLLQRTGHRVSSLRGRYLHIRARLIGTAQATPEIAAVRAYASRFSYADRYLPELYHETEFGPDADHVSEATTEPDFLNRFLCLFESILTPIEDRIANAHLLTHPASARAQDLEWLAQWLGVTFDPALPPERRREWLKAAPEMARWRGTLRGFALALETATGGGVSGGEIIIVENYRLRRVLATILGVDLTDYDDPLLPGAEYGGNSIVGDTLVLGDENEREFLALFADSLRKKRSEEHAIDELYEELAHRVTVLVHQEVEPQDLALIRRIAEREKPAHVLLTVAPASFPFLAGIASLVGVDTYLAGKPRPGPVRVGESRLGVWDVVKQPGSLDPNFRG